MIESTLKIFVFDEVHVNGPVEIKEPVTFIERVFSIFRRVDVTPNLLARPPTLNLGAMKSALRLLRIAFIDSSLKTRP
jgi:hypothetical protein